jgi:hypothetical protein
MQVPKWTSPFIACGKVAIECKHKINFDPPTLYFNDIAIFPGIG